MGFLTSLAGLFRPTPATVPAVVVSAAVSPMPPAVAGPIVASVAPLAATAPLPLWFSRTDFRSLSDDDFAAAARTVGGGCTAAHIRAACQVEAPGGGFGADGRPTLLFEPALFSAATGHAYDGASDAWGLPLSVRSWSAGLKYGLSASQWSRLVQAEHLAVRGMPEARARDAAWCSASWGRYQILASNHALCGFATPEEFVRAMCSGEQAQLAAFLAFLNSRNLCAALASGDWSAYARGYNGSGQVVAYAARLESAYTSIVAKGVYA